MCFSLLADLFIIEGCSELQNFSTLFSVDLGFVIYILAEVW